MIDVGGVGGGEAVGGDVAGGDRRFVLKRKKTRKGEKSILTISP